VASPGRAVVAAALAVLLVGAAGPALAESRVGIVVATRVNLDEGEADRLAARLGEALRRELEVDVIAGAEARRRLPPDGIPEDCVARPDCVRDVATRLDGHELLFLFLARIGPRVQIDVTWADPGSGTVTSRAAVVVQESAGREDQALAVAPRQLLPSARPRASHHAEATAASGGGGSPLSGPAPQPPAAPVGFAEGLEAREGGRRITIPVVVAGAVAAAALGTGLGFAIAARQDYDSLDEDGCARMVCAGVEGRIDHMERRALVADVLFATAGIAGATGVILYLRSGSSGDAEREARVGVRTVGRGAIVSLAGRF
jgi:hypothetical protein